MSCLDATFTLTPQSPLYSQGPRDQAHVYCFGADFHDYSPLDYSSLYTSNRWFFNASFASDPNLDYTNWNNRRRGRFVESIIDLGDHGTEKQLALIFGFDVLFDGIDGRVLVYSDAGLLHDQRLAYGDNQFMLLIESLDQPLILYFIHAGGYWFFKGLSGYVV